MKSESSPSEKRQGAKRNGISRKSRTDWARIFDSSEQVKPTPEHPEADVDKIVKGIVRRGLMPTPNKVLISLRLDEDVIEWFKAQGPGYQTRINAILRAFRDAST